MPARIQRLLHDGSYAAKVQQTLRLEADESALGADGFLYRRGRRRPATVPPPWVSRQIVSQIEMKEGFAERFCRYLEDPGYEDQLYEITIVKTADGWKHHSSGWTYQPSPIVPLRQHRASSDYPSEESHLQALDHAQKLMGRTCFGGRVRTVDAAGDVLMDKLLAGELPRRSPIEVDLWPWQNAQTDVRVGFRTVGVLPAETAEQLQALSERGYRFQGQLLLQDGEFLLEFRRRR